MSLKSSAVALPLIVEVSEDAWQGDAQFIVLVDGHQLGGVQTATANHAGGEWQDITLDAGPGANPGAVSIRFLNDAWGGSAAADRNLYVNSLVVDGTIYQGSAAQNDAGGFSTGNAAVLNVNGAVTFRPEPVSPPVPPPPHTLTLTVSEDVWQGDAQFVVLVDGHQLGGVQTATANHAGGEWQDITLDAGPGANPGTVSIGFLNDAWGGSAAADRNLYVNSLVVDGTTYQGSAAQEYAGAFSVGTAEALHTNGAITFDVASPARSLPNAAQAVAFSANDYISAGDVLQYDSGQSWSASAVLKIDTLPPAYAANLPEGGANLVFGNTNGAPYRGYEAWVDDEGRLRVRIMESFMDGKYIDVAGTTDIVDGRWLAIGVTYDGSSSAHGVKLFINGTVEPVQVIKDTLSGSSASDGPMIIGNQLNGWEDQFQLRGQMAAFAISDQVRDAAYFNPNDAAFNILDSHTQLAYSFGKGSGLVAEDLSGHSNNGVLSGASMWAPTT